MGKSGLINWQFFKQLIWLSHTEGRCIDENLVRVYFVLIEFCILSNNTLAETFTFGKPLIIIPLFGDQVSNNYCLVIIITK